MQEQLINCLIFFFEAKLRLVGKDIRHFIAFHPVKNEKIKTFNELVLSRNRSVRFGVFLLRGLI